MTKDEALKLALRALRFAHDDGYENEVSHDAITAIKQARSAPVQEPVLWQWKDSEMVSPFDKTNVEGWTPLYTTPSAAQPAPVQEPVAWCVLEPWLSGKFEAQDCFSDVALDANVGWVPLYTTPPAAQRQWVGLSEEEIDKLKHLIDWTATWSHGRFAYEIEQLLKEKNA